MVIGVDFVGEDCGVLCVDDADDGGLGGDHGGAAAVALPEDSTGQYLWTRHRKKVGECSSTFFRLVNYDNENVKYTILSHSIQL